MAGNEIIALGILLMAGFAGGKASYAARLPSVTGYIVAGLLLGPSLLDLITPETIEKLEFINSLALSLIAISVGGKLDLPELTGRLKTILTVSIVQTVLVGVGTFAALAALGINPALALLLAATALATAPAAVMAVVEETKAKGPFTNTLLAVVALSNVLAVEGLKGVERGNIRVIETRQHLSLAFESSMALGIVREILRQRLHCYLTAKFRILNTPYLAHAASTE